MSQVGLVMRREIMSGVITHSSVNSFWFDALLNLRVSVSVTGEAGGADGVPNSGAR